MAIYETELRDFVDVYSLSNERLRGVFFMGEADVNGNIEAANNATNIIVVEKTMANLRVSANSVINLDQNKMKEVVEKANKINEIAEGIAATNKENSEYVKMHKNLIAIVDGFDKKFGPKYGKSSTSYQGDLVVAGLNFLLVEFTGIIAEAIINVSTGSFNRIDDYINKNPKYKEIFNKINITDKGYRDLNKSLNDLGEQLYKESHDVESLHPVMSDMLQGVTTIYQESSVSIFRVFKALLFKPLYIILAPIRYIIYLFMYAGFKIADRLTQIADTIALYDEDVNKNTNPATREQKLRDLERQSSTIRIDRAEADAKIVKRIEEDKQQLTKSVDSASNAAILQAIF